jgi:hypothetical protein
MSFFARSGPDPVTVSEIAGTAGVSEGSVFNYFPTKEVSLRLPVNPPSAVPLGCGSGAGDPAPYAGSVRC